MLISIRRKKTTCTSGNHSRIFPFLGTKKGPTHCSIGPLRGSDRPTWGLDGPTWGSRETTWGSRLLLLLEFPVLSLMIGMIVPKLNCDGANMKLKSVSFKKRMRGAFWKGSACRPSSSGLFPSFLPQTVSIVVSIEILNSLQLQFWAWLNENSRYLSSNWDTLPHRVW